MEYPKIKSPRYKGDYFFVDKRSDGKYEIKHYDANAWMNTDAYLFGDDYLFGDKPDLFDSGIQAYKFMKEHIMELD